MSRSRWLIAVIVVATFTAPFPAQQPDAPKVDPVEAAKQALEKSGGRVIDYTTPDGMTRWRVDFQSTTIDEGKLRLVQAVPNITELWLEDCQFTDPGLKELVTMKGLRRLHLLGGGLNDAVLRRVTGLAGLHDLALENAEVSDAGLKAVADLKNLVELRLCRLAITDQGMKAVGAMRGLLRLDIESAEITDAGLKDLANLKGIDSITLTHNRLTGAALRDLGRALPQPPGARPAVAQPAAAQPPPDDVVVEGPVTAGKMPALVLERDVAHAPGEDELTRMLKLRRNLAAREMRARIDEVRIGRKTLADAVLQTAFQRRIESGLDVIEKPADRVVFLKKCLEYAQMAERDIDERFDAGQLDRQTRESARYVRIDTAVKLLRAENEARRAERGNP